MKTRKLGTILVLTGLAGILFSCNKGVNDVEESIVLSNEIKSAESVAAAGDYSLSSFSGVLTHEDIDGLIEMREEEKLARDVYTKLFELHNQVVFNNISKSENVHMSAVLYLLKGYGLEDPALSGEGEFSNPMFSDLYGQLTEQGASDLISALKVGAFIEEYDIADLRRLIDETENVDIKRVYGNLLKGSEFHLRAFTFALKQQGATYEPTVISDEECLEILDASNDSETETISTTFGTCDGTGPNA